MVIDSQASWHQQLLQPGKAAMPTGQKSTDTREAPYSASQRCQHSPTEVTCEPSTFNAAELEPPEHQPASCNEQYDGDGDAGGEGGGRGGLGGASFLR